jgi:hypothetical protein
MSSQRDRERENASPGSVDGRQGIEVPRGG